MGNDNMLKTVCVKDMCSGCMACLEICHKDAIRIEDSLRAYNAVKTDKCVECGACHKVCQQNNPPIAVAPIVWRQGWAKDEKIRKIGASGGYASAIAGSFVEQGGIVCSCAFADGIFGFHLTRTIEGLRDFAGSKYVKSNPIGIYRQIKKLLCEGERVLYIALPCQVAAIKNFVGEKLLENLYTIDLICHGTPSPKILQFFLNQYNVSLNQIDKIQFRNKIAYFDNVDELENFTTKGTDDRYVLSFLHCLIYTNNCYDCQYAKKERVSDITLGDSWGTSLPFSETDKGVSLLLCQTEKGQRLLELAALESTAVNPYEAVAHNIQLRHSSLRPATWKQFFDNIEKGKSFNASVFSSLSNACIRQSVKQIFICLGIKKVMGVNYRITYIRK